MKLFFVSECRFIKVGIHYYVNNSAFANELWNRYLKSFSEIIICARVEKLKEVAMGADWILISNQNIVFIDLPYYIGPIQYLKVRSKLKSIIRENIYPNARYICRVPGTIGDNVSQILRKRNIPYAVEVVGDPWDVFSPGTINHKLRPILRLIGYMRLKKIVRNSCAALYVTERKLQSRYHTKKGTFTTSASNVSISDECFASEHKKLNKYTNFNLLSIGSLEQMYKSPDILIKAISILKDWNMCCNLTWLGDGKYKWEMMNYANDLGVIKQVHFLGNVSKDVVFDKLNESDLYVHPSRTEGLPRAVIEAMSQGLPCIGTNIGGIPELLSENSLVPINDPNALALKIKEFLTTKNLAYNEAKRNLLESHKYKESILNKRRSKFYTEIINFSK